MSHRLRWTVSSALRTFTTSVHSRAASNFLMPAMSPTMTEGNISTWKVKEGDAYAAGDVILEIETDKATMDVEAQDDGILAKILVGDGKKAVAVGTRIAVMAEPGDDVASLDMPRESETPAARQEEKVDVKEARQEDKRPEGKEEEKRPVTGKGAKGHGHQTNKDGSTLSPAVQRALVLHGVEDAHAVPATGPKGRLLKGDVLAFASKIDGASTKIVADAFVKRGKMDLSNIKRASTPEAPAAKKVEEAAAAPRNPVVEVHRQVDLNQLVLMSEKMSEELGVEMTVADLTMKAAERALSDFPAFASSDPSPFDQAFDEIISGQSRSMPVAPSPLSRQEPARITLNVEEYFEGGPIKLPARAPASTLLTLQAATPALPEAIVPADYDILDFLSDRPILPRQTAPLHSPQASPNVMIASLSFNEGSVNSEKASIYLDRVSQYIESPSHLLL